MRLRIVLAVLVLAGSVWVALPVFGEGEMDAGQVCCSGYIDDCPPGSQCKAGSCSPQQTGECVKVGD